MEAKLVAMQATQTEGAAVTTQDLKRLREEMQEDIRIEARRMADAHNRLAQDFHRQSRNVDETQLISGRLHSLTEKHNKNCDHVEKTVAELRDKIAFLEEHTGLSRVKELQQENEQMREKLRDANASAASAVSSATMTGMKPRCVVCMDRDVRLVVTPCWHAVLCKECRDELMRKPGPLQCPVCKSDVRTYNDIYFT